MRLLSFFLALGFLSSLSFSFKRNDLFQVVTSHPHDLVELKPYLETVYQNGRLWVVRAQEETPEELKLHLRPLLGGEKSYLLEGKIFSNAKIKKKDSVKLLIESANKDFIRKDVEKLASYRSRAAGTKDNQAAVQEMSDRLKSLGYGTKNICYSPDACSVIADKEGTEKTGKVILIMAHIDSVGEAFAGADDNATGVAVLLEMARLLKEQKLKNSIRFFISNGEERGLLGASHYVRTLSAASKLQEISFVINMDMVGYNANGIIELETNPEFEDEALWYANIAGRYSDLKPKITLGAWGSDHVVFLRRGIPSIMVIENWDTKTPCFHLECDTPDTVNYDYATEIARMNTAAVMIKDSDLLP
jgi:hypothetical protein